MTKLLLRLFIPNHSRTDDPKVRGAIGSLSGAVGICCNLLLFVLKLVVGTLSGSVSITADAMNNLSDASGSIVTLLGFRLAGKPADRHHPYGHARYEYISGLTVAALILVIGFELAKSSIQKIFQPAAVEFTFFTALVLFCSIGIKLWLFLFNRYLGRTIDSSALLATAADSRNDCIATGAVVLAGVIEGFLNIRVDGFFGLAVAVFILYSGASLARDTISPLLGENADPELRRKILDYIAAQPKVLGYHDLLVHEYGPGQRFATLHVEMDHREDPLECHERINHMEWECLQTLGIHLVIHYDPVITDDPVLNRLRETCCHLLKAKDDRLSLHDFRMVQGRHHMNLIFDVALPMELRGREEELRRFVEDSLNTVPGQAYHVTITFDMA